MNKSWLSFINDSKFKDENKNNFHLFTEEYKIKISKKIDILTAMKNGSDWEWKIYNDYEFIKYCFNNFKSIKELEKIWRNNLNFEILDNLPNLLWFASDTLIRTNLYSENIIPPNWFIANEQDGWIMNKNIQESIFQLFNQLKDEIKDTLNNFLDKKELEKFNAVYKMTSIERKILRLAILNNWESIEDFDLDLIANDVNRKKEFILRTLKNEDILKSLIQINKIWKEKISLSI